ncbi:GNAT family N-acetyltransferase [Collimonas sp.]|uniref:GNAT family N-acetyltransferase n=1 Tax=Collimonas sp. TaxID=1963772 RepID=UPI0037C19EF6
MKQTESPILLCEATINPSAFCRCEDASPVRSDELLDTLIGQSIYLPRTRFQCAITTKRGELIGACGIPPEARQQASIGCELGRKWLGSGYALEAANTVMHFGF